MKTLSKTVYHYLQFYLFWIKRVAKKVLNSLVWQMIVIFSRVKCFFNFLKILFVRLIKSKPDDDRYLPIQKNDLLYLIPPKSESNCQNPPYHIVDFPRNIIHSSQFLAKKSHDILNVFEKQTGIKPAECNNQLANPDLNTNDKEHSLFPYRQKICQVNQIKCLFYQDRIKNQIIVYSNLINKQKWFPGFNKTQIALKNSARGEKLEKNDSLHLNSPTQVEIKQGQLTGQDQLIAYQHRKDEIKRCNVSIDFFSLRKHYFFPLLKNIVVYHQFIEGKDQF